MINKQQLVESVLAVYGSRTNASEYLQKFIDVEFRLPKSNHGPTPDPEKLCEKLLEQHQLDKSDELNNGFAEFVSDFARYGNLSLREIERAFRTFVLFRMMFGEGYDRFKSRFQPQRFCNLHAAVFYVCVTKVIDQNHFRSIFEGKCSKRIVGEVWQARLHGVPADSPLRTDLRVVELLAATDAEFKEEPDDDLKRVIHTTIVNSNNIRSRIFPIICKVINGFQDF